MRNHLKGTSSSAGNEAERRIDLFATPRETNAPTASDDIPPCPTATLPSPESIETTYFASWDYEPVGENKANELALIEGDIYTVILKDNKGWWYTKNALGGRGWAPSSYLKEGKQSANRPITKTKKMTVDEMRQMILEEGAKRMMESEICKMVKRGSGVGFEERLQILESLQAGRALNSAQSRHSGISTDTLIPKETTGESLLDWARKTTHIEMDDLPTDKTGTLLEGCPYSIFDMQLALLEEENRKRAGIETGSIRHSDTSEIPKGGNVKTSGKLNNPGMRKECALMEKSRETQCLDKPMRLRNASLHIVVEMSGSEIPREFA